MDASNPGETADSDDISQPVDEVRPPKARSIRPLVMIWRQALNYPGRVVLALIALSITAAATLANKKFLTWLFLLMTLSPRLKK